VAYAFPMEARLVQILIESSRECTCLTLLPTLADNVSRPLVPFVVTNQAAYLIQQSFHCSCMVGFWTAGPQNRDTL